MTVTEIDKPLRTDCKNLCEQGCSIYSERPTSCQTFECVWLSGWIGNEDYRPDKFGLMLTTIQIDGEVILNAWEVWKDASTGSKQDYFLKKMSTKLPIILRKFDGGTRMYGKRSEIQSFLKRHTQ